MTEPAPPRALFAFDRDRWCSVFGSVQDAEDQLETNDVEAGEYVVFADDGTVLDAAVQGTRVVLTATGSRDLPELRTRLADSLRLRGIVCASDDVIDHANAILQADWEERWPKRPRRLSRRLFGDAPPRIRP